MPKIVIIGAGISGLSLGWFLKKKFHDDIELQILEEREASGGYIKTIKKDDFLFELGCRSCRTTGNGLFTLQLIEDLKLESEVIVADPSAKNRYIYKNNKLESIPRGIFSFLKSPLTKGLLKAACRDFFKAKRLNSEKEESIYEFIKRRFSKKVAEELMDPLTSGIYAGDIRKLSLKSCFPKFYELENEYRSVLKGMFFSKKKVDVGLSSFVQDLRKKSIFSFKGGMQTLTRSLTDRLKENVLYETKIAKLECLPNQTIIHLIDGPTINADIVYSTIPASKLAPLLNSQPILEVLNQFSYSSIATVSFGFKGVDFKQQGFGYLIPSSEKTNILGAVFDSSVFKEQNQSCDETRLTFMIGGAHMADFDKYSQDDFLELALKAKKEHLNIKETPDSIHVEIIRNAIAQYTIGHSERVSLIKDLSPPHLKILGSSFFGVSVNDCIAQSKFFADSCKF